MFLFIAMLIYNIVASCDLNTSYVLIYHLISLLSVPFRIFKYILCSYLSENELEQRTDTEINLNTSYMSLFPRAQHCSIQREAVSGI